MGQPDETGQEDERGLGMGSGNSQCQSSIVEASGMSKAEKNELKNTQGKTRGLQRSQTVPKRVTKYFERCREPTPTYFSRVKNYYSSNPSSSIPWLTIKLNGDSQSVVISKLTWREIQNKHQNERFPSFPRKQSLRIFFPSLLFLLHHFNRKCHASNF